MLANIINKIKGIVKADKNDIFTALVVVLVAIIGFGLGRLSAIYDQKEPIKIGYRDQSASAANLAVQPPGEGSKDKNPEKPFVASINSDKYHLEQCAGAQRIKEENKIRFATKEEAEAAGFKPAGNCEGL